MTSTPQGICPFLAILRINGPRRWERTVPDSAGLRDRIEVEEFEKVVSHLWQIGIEVVRLVWWRSMVGPLMQCCGSSRG